MNSAMHHWKSIRNWISGAAKNLWYGDFGIDIRYLVFG